MGEGYHYRTEFLPEDLAYLEEVAKKTKFFPPHEVDVLVSIGQEVLDCGKSSGYYFVFIQKNQQKLGFACYGEIPEAVNNFDLYWMIVNPEFQRQGLGKLLIHRVEMEVEHLDGRQINIETSSRELYLPTRKFYEDQGYQQSACLPDYYAIGDDKLCYYKNLKT